MYLIRTISLQIAEGICYTRNSAVNIAAYKILSKLINAVKQDGGINSYPIYCQIEDKSDSGLLGDYVNEEKHEEENAAGPLGEYNRLLSLLTQMGLKLPDYTMEQK